MERGEWRERKKKGKKRVEGDLCLFFLRSCENTRQLPIIIPCSKEPEMKVMPRTTSYLMTFLLDNNDYNIQSL